MYPFRPSYPLAIAIIILATGTLTGVTLWAVADQASWALDVAVAVASLAAALAQLWWPVRGALAATLLATLSPVATPAATLGALQVAQRRRFPVAAGVAAAGMAAHLVQGLWRPSSGISLPWWLLLICAAYGALLGWGALARSRRALLASLHERARRAEAEQGRRVAEARAAERRLLAREMHDVLAHRLSLVATHAGALEYRPEASPEQLARAAGVVRTGVRQALEELRQVISLLREQDDERDEFEPPPGLADLPGLIGEAREAGQPVRLRDEVTGTPPPRWTRPPPGDPGGPHLRPQTRPRPAGRGPQIVEAVTRVAAGDPILSPRVTRRLMERAIAQAGAYERARAALAVLTPREHEVALAIARGRTNADIAEDLSMGVTTVKAHVSSILAKLDLDNRTQIALLAHDAGLTWRRGAHAERRVLHVDQDVGLT